MAYDNDADAKKGMPGTPKGGTPKKPANMLDAMKRRASKPC